MSGSRQYSRTHFNLPLPQGPKKIIVGTSKVEKPHNNKQNGREDFKNTLEDGMQIEVC